MSSKTLRLASRWLLLCAWLSLLAACQFERPTTATKSTVVDHIDEVFRQEVCKNFPHKTASHGDTRETQVSIVADNATRWRVYHCEDEQP